MKLIQDDAQYEKARLELIKMAAELDDPLSSMSDYDRRRTNLIYDRTVESVREYRRSELVVTFPGLKDAYTRLGVPFRDFSKALKDEQENEQEQEPDPAPVSRPPAPAREPEQPAVKPAASRLSAWLED